MTPILSWAPAADPEALIDAEIFKWKPSAPPQLSDLQLRKAEKCV